MKDVLILTGTHKATNEVFIILEKGGIGGKYQTSGVWDCILVSEDKQRVNDGSLQFRFTESSLFSNGRDLTVYHHSELTPAIVATFPGAREIAPPGPFPYGGVGYEVDGDKRRVPGSDEIYVNEFHKIATRGQSDNHREYGHKRWILKPVISAEHIAAREQLQKCEESEESASVATNQARVTVAQYEALECK